MQAKHSKPNRTVLRIFSTATFLAMIASCSVSAFAGTYDLNNGDVYVEVKNDAHYVSQVTHYNDDGSREYYKDGEGHTHDGSEAETDNQVTITSKGKSTANIIDVKTEDKNQVANITLDNVHADAEDRWHSRADANWNNGGCTSAMTVNGEGTTNIELKGDNYLQGQYGGIVNETGATTSAGLEFNATDLDGKKNGTLNINDAGNDGSLHAVSGTWGAGIGGILGQDSGDIVINGGKVTGEAHNSSQGAGIGGGDGGAGNVTINGGTVSGTGYVGAGIGGGVGGDGNVTINDGSVTAKGGNVGAGIGSGGNGGTSNVIITGGVIEKAAGGMEGAGIGGDRYSTVKILGKTGIETVTGSITGIGSGNGAWADVTIEDSKLDTVTGKGGTGIGAGTGGRGGVTIKGTVLGSVTGEQGAGIGGGIAGTANITISNGKVGTARGTGKNPGNASTITIKNNSVIGLAENTDTEQGSAGIGFGSGYNNGSTLTISGSEVKKAVGGAGAAGIGGGYKTGFLTIELIDSILRDINGAGIGTGAYDSPASFPTTINLRNTTVENAAGATGAAGIGGGYNTSIGVGSSDTNISISGGNVTATAGKMRGESFGSTAANAPFAIGSGALLDVNFFKSFSNVTINGDASDTIVTAIASDLDHAISQLANITVDSLGEAHKVLINMKDSSGTLLKAIHNRAYVGYPADADVNEAHAWDEGVIIREATPEQKGLKRYTCTVDGCDGAKVEEYEYVAPAPVEPTDPDTPGTKPGTPATPDTPADSPVQDTATADTTPADSTVLPGNAQNPDALDGKPGDAAAAPANAKNPAVQDAKALPQTGSNWLTVLGTALSGLWLMAVGFFLNRKRGENR